MSFAEKQANCPPKWRKVILSRMRSRFLRDLWMQKSSSRTDELFCTRSGIPPVRHMDHDCEGEQPEEENLCPISQKNKKKKISHSAGLVPLL